MNLALWLERAGRSHPAAAAIGYGKRVAMDYGALALRAARVAGAFVVKLVGSYSNVVGLPLYEAVALLAGEGYPIHFGWVNPP